MLVHSLPTLTTRLMWKSVFVFLLILSIAATPSRNGKQCSTIRRSGEVKKCRLRECESRIYVRDAEKGKKLCCYQEPAHAEYSRRALSFNCTDARSLKDFTVNDVQYLVVTDLKKGRVTLLRWDEDDREFRTQQILYVEKPYSAEVVQHRGRLLLLVAVFDGQQCGQCGLLRSPVYQWDHVAGRFNETSIQELPSSKYIRWFLDRHNGESTAFLVIGRCTCDTLLYSWDRRANQFQKIDQPDFGRVPDSSDIVVQSVRHQRTQYTLSAQLKGDSSIDHAISVSRWSQSQGMVSQRHLDVRVHGSAQQGLSVHQYKGQVFMCTITKGNRRGLMTTISKLQFESDNDSFSVSKTEVGRTEDKNHYQSFCTLFVNNHDKELYVAVGYYTRPTSLMRYSLITDSFSDAGELSQDIGAFDLVTFQNGDDFFIATVTNTTSLGCRVNLFSADL
ncbi:uncharacterized protein LOC119737529 [Patiria miniata]|uniref:Uncharacterized protein n=1 Tax=Patiria miniata TaxID=46514 RepID=A0A914AWK3_PATMI|nr:uncharacterized protein LOC119737529 [Patiria miniata]